MITARKIYSINAGNLPKETAEQFISDLMVKHQKAKK